MRSATVSCVVVLLVGFALNVAAQQSAIRTVDFQAMEDERDNVRKYDLLRVAYGDVTGDGIEDAIVLFRGRGVPADTSDDEIWLVEMRRQKPLMLAQIRTTKPFEYFLSVVSLGSVFKIENKTIFMDKAFRIDRGKMQYYTAKYYWDGARMVELERSASRSLPNNMREIG